MTNSLVCYNNQGQVHICPHAKGRHSCTQDLSGTRECASLVVVDMSWLASSCTTRHTCHSFDGLLNLCGCICRLQTILSVQAMHEVPGVSLPLQQIFYLSSELTKSKKQRIVELTEVRIWACSMAILFFPLCNSALVFSSCFGDLDFVIKSEE
mmetsp:Transcript_7589/g.11155  ORF Transcript_7589/g.11155 Transcript_7589/m.11155 type:complete len:153 (+) Transcript_7589:1067-1525(+)